MCSHYGYRKLLFYEEISQQANHNDPRIRLILRQQDRSNHDLLLYRCRVLCNSARFHRNKGSNMPGDGITDRNVFIQCPLFASL